MPSALLHPPKVVRWIAAVVYSTAILGALIVPHHHGGPGDACCHSGATCAAVHCLLHSHDNSPHGCEHDAHDSHGPHHAHEAADPDHEPAPEPTHEDCPYCRFLAQAVQLTAAPAVSEIAAPARQAVIAACPAGSPVEVSTPPARGPPVC